MAQKLMIVDLNLNGNQIKNVVAEGLSTAPSNPVAGQFFFDTEASLFKYYDGTQWIATDAKPTAASLAADGTVEGITTYSIYDSFSNNEFKFRAIKSSQNISLSKDANGVITISIAGLSTDGTFTGNSDTLIPTQKAAKTYTDNAIITAIQALDVTDEAVSNQFVTSVSEEDGVISVTRAQPAASGITLSSSNTFFTSIDDVQEALEALADQVGVITLTEGDTVIDINDNTGEGATGKNISMKIASTDKFLTKETTGLQVNFNVVKNTTNLPAGVKEQYKLTDKSGNTVGDIINVYNDTSLHNFYLGHVDDALTAAGGNGESATDAITNGTGATALVWVMKLQNGNYKLAAVNVSSFLEESEFADGLEVDNHVVKVKIDSTSGTVRTAADVLYTAEDAEVIAGTKNVGDVKTSGLVGVITVSANGIKLDNIQAAITYAVNTAKATIDAYTVNGKAISTSPTLGGGDIDLSNSYAKATHGQNESPANIAAGDDLETAISKLEDKTDTNSARIAAIEAVTNGAYQYVTTANTGSSATVLATAHKCGTVPSVTTYWKGHEIVTDVAINSSGDVTVTWNGTVASAEYPITIKIVG